MGRKMLIKEASAALGLSKHSLRNAIRSGEIPYFMVGNRYILDVDLVENILEKVAIENMHSRKNAQMKNGLRKVCD